MHMKMTELRAENESLKQQLQLLSQQKGDEKDTAAITQLKEKNRSLKKSVKDLKAEKVTLSGKIKTLESDKLAIEQEHQLLITDFDHIKQQLSELSDVHTQMTTEVESLRVAQQALQKQASQLPIMQAELNRLRQIENMLSEKTAQAVALQVDLEQNEQLLEDVQAKAAKELAEVQDQREKLRSEMDATRNMLQAELEAHRAQSSTQITSLQAQKDGLSTKLTELTEKLKLVATTLEKQLLEKRNLTNQYNSSIKELQANKEKSDKQVSELMVLLQKMGAELDASRAAHSTQITQPVKVDGVKTDRLGNASSLDKQPQLRLKELQDQLAALGKINASQAQELTELTTRIKRINHSLATPLGRLISPLLGLKE